MLLIIPFPHQVVVISCRIMPIGETSLPEFDQEMTNTRKILECVPEDAYFYQPHEKSMTLIRLASHVADLPNWVVETMHKEKLELMPGQAPYIAKSNAELMAAFDKNSAACAAIEGANDEDFGAPSEGAIERMGGDVADDLPAAGCRRYACGGCAAVADRRGAGFCAPTEGQNRETPVGEHERL